MTVRRSAGDLIGRPTERRAVFRLVNADGGVGYFEFHLRADEKGGTRIDDVYVYSSGELLSATMRRLYVTGRGQAEQGGLDRLMGKERSFIENAPKLQKMVEDLRAQRWDEVMAAYDSLPEAVQNERSTAILNLTASAQLDDGERYLKAFNNYEKLFPGDPSLDLFAIDAPGIRTSTC